MEARKTSTIKMKNSDTPETNHASFTAIHIDGDGVPTDFARNLERQRDEARRMWSIHQDKLAGLREQVRLTIMENLHLADGDECTPKRLKDAISFELEDSSANT